MEVKGTKEEKEEANNDEADASNKADAIVDQEMEDKTNSANEADEEGTAEEGDKKAGEAANEQALDLDQILVSDRVQSFLCRHGQSEDADSDDEAIADAMLADFLGPATNKNYPCFRTHSLVKLILEVQSANRPTNSNKKFSQKHIFQ